MKLDRSYLLLWRKRNVNDKQLLIALSIVVGFTSGIAAISLKTLVFFISKLLKGNVAVNYEYFGYFIFPAIGLILTVLFLKYIIRDNVMHNIPRILYVISREKGLMKRHKMWSSVFSGGLTVGFGGSVGLESPIISTGSAIGSNLAQYFKLNYRTRILLIGCGAAGAISAIFNTPIAAIIFALEVLMLDLTMGSLIPLLIASVTGAITSKLLLNDSILISFNIKDPFLMGDIPYIVLLGIILGLLAYGFSSLNLYIHDKLKTYNNSLVKALIGGSILGLLIFVFPPLYGEGYSAIKVLVNGDYETLLNNSFFYLFKDSIAIVLIYLFLLIGFKMLASSITIESGGVGGIFAPSAFIGGVMGFVFSQINNILPFGHKISVVNFILIGMAGMLSAILHAPLTAVFLIAELTNGYDLIVPLMLTSAFSFITIKIFDDHSIFTKKLALQGDLMTHQKDQAVLTLLQVKRVIDKDLICINPNYNLGELTKVIAKSKRNAFPVLGENNEFLGVIDLDDVREDMFNSDKYTLSVMEYLLVPKATVSTSDSMETVMQRFKETGYYNLPVVDDGIYVGFLSRANIFKAYRKTLQQVSEDY